MSDLKWFIYWTDVGEVGYLEFQKRLKRKKLAQQMTGVDLGLDVDVTPDKVNKMISKAIEAQEKADMAAKRKKFTSYFQSSKKGKQKGQRTTTGQRRYQQNQRGSRGSPSSGSRSGNKQSSARKPSSPRRRQSNHRS